MKKSICRHLFILTESRQGISTQQSASFLDDLSTITDVEIFLLLYYLKKLGLNFEHQGDSGNVYI